MIVWLDFLIFGRGYGLAQPRFDGRFYWLSGQFYTFIGGLGAQLQSFQWRHPRPGESRRLAGRDYRPFNSRRQGLRVSVSWATRLPSDLNEANAEIRKIETELGRV
jgi:hypothetical protein